MATLPDDLSNYFYLGNLVHSVMPIMANKLQLCNGILGSATLLTFGTLFVFMARFAERWDSVRKRERRMYRQMEEALQHLDGVLNQAGCYRYEAVRELLGNYLVPLLHHVSQIRMPTTIISDPGSEAVVHKVWRSLPRRFAFCFNTLQRDDMLSLAVFLVDLSKILYSVLNALSLVEVAKESHAMAARELIGGQDGMLHKLLNVASITGIDAHLVQVGDAFVPWLHITSELSPGTALKRGLPIKRVHSIYLKMSGPQSVEYRAKVDVDPQEMAS